MSFGETESSMSLPSREDSGTSSQSQCSTAPGLIAGTWHRPLFLTRDRWFESGSLQQRVRCEPDPRERIPSVACRATRDLLKSFGWGIGALHRLDAATK